eukprot:365265-Chlamydomonas_euryale.AAC.2
MHGQGGRADARQAKSSHPMRHLQQRERLTVSNAAQSASAAVRAIGLAGQHTAVDATIPIPAAAGAAAGICVSATIWFTSCIARAYAAAAATLACSALGLPRGSARGRLWRQQQRGQRIEGRTVVALCVLQRNWAGRSVWVGRIGPGGAVGSGGHRLGAPKLSHRNPQALTCAPLSSHLCAPEFSPGRARILTWAPPSSHMGAPDLAPGPPQALTWAPPNSHLGAPDLLHGRPRGLLRGGP